MAQNAFSQSDRSIFRNHILHTNPKKVIFSKKKSILFFHTNPKKVQFFYFFQKSSKKNFHTNPEKVQFFFDQFFYFFKKKIIFCQKNEKLSTRGEAPCKFIFLAHE